MKMNCFSCCKRVQDDTPKFQVRKTGRRPYSNSVRALDSVFATLSFKSGSSRCRHIRNEILKMMEDAVMHIPEEPPTKRPGSEQVQTTELTVMKRQKLGDPKPEEPVVDTVGMQSDSKERDNLSDSEDDELSYCLICCDMVDHIILECPNKSKGSGTCCFICKGPCKSSNDEHHIENHFETIMFCNGCGSQAKHWTDDCPYGPELLSPDTYCGRESNDVIGW